MFEMYHARLTGIAHCIVPQHLPIPVDSISNNLLQQPPLELLASIMQPNQLHPLSPNQMPMIQTPSIVQIIVPANSIPVHGTLVDKSPNMAPISTTAATTHNNNDINETVNDEDYTSQTQEPLHSGIPQASSTPFQEVDREDDIDEMILNEDDSSDYQVENEDRSKKQRDRSDFRYVESFEGEKSNIPMRRYDPDSESELKNVINENFSQIPSVLPVPKALSSPKDTSSSTELLDEPPEPIQDHSTSDK
jgi:hypothetical protein